MSILTDDSIMFNTDSYKNCHWSVYHPATTQVISYMESRGGRFSELLTGGIEPFVLEHLAGQQVQNIDQIDEAREFYKEHFIGHDYFPYEGWKYILNEHGGYLPLEIKAAPEGLVIPTKNIMMLLYNTDLKFERYNRNAYWLTNFVETCLLNTWHPITVGTLSREVKKILIKHLLNTSDMPIEDLLTFVIPYMLHDFGARGATGPESAARAGAVHLYNFLGTDTVKAMRYLLKAFDCKDQFPGYSVFATEHSVATSEGPSGEGNVLDRILQVVQSGIASTVGDSYDIMHYVQLLADRIEIISTRKDGPLGTPGRTVLRPDSGDPIITNLNIIEALGEKFGYDTNRKGYKVLPNYIRIIQGDGVNIDMIDEFLSFMATKGWAAENWVFGMGGALHQKDVDRDVQNFAIKCCAQIRDGEVVEIEKNPIVFNADGTRTQSFKKSKKGLMKLVKDAEGIKTVGLDEPGDDLLETIFLNGKMTKKSNLAEIRQRARVEIPIEVEA